MGVEEGNETAILERFTFSSMGRQLVIPPNHFMAFRIGILTPTEKEGATNATVYVETNYQKFEVPFRFRVAKGSLHTVPKELIFDPVFPGKKNVSVLFLHYIYLNCFVYIRCLYNTEISHTNLFFLFRQEN